MKHILSIKQRKLLLRIWHDQKDEDEKRIRDEMDRIDKMQPILLEEDIYCMGFTLFLTSDEAIVKNRLVLKAVIAFIF